MQLKTLRWGEASAPANPRGPLMSKTAMFLLTPPLFCPSAFCFVRKILDFGASWCSTIPPHKKATMRVAYDLRFEKRGNPKKMLRAHTKA